MHRPSLSALIAASATTAVLLATPASAHHSFTSFDRDKILTVAGTVKDFQWTNPHVWIQLLAPGANGAPPMEWSIEGGSVDNMKRGGGWKKSSLNIGDKVVVYFHPLRTGAPGGELVNASVAGKLIGPEKVS
jgi:hypothetical protein